MYTSKHIFVVCALPSYPSNAHGVSTSLYSFFLLLFFVRFRLRLPFVIYNGWKKPIAHRWILRFSFFDDWGLYLQFWTIAGSCVRNKHFVTCHRIELLRFMTNLTKSWNRRRVPFLSLRNNDKFVWLVVFVVVDIFFGFDKFNKFNWFYLFVLFFLLLFRLNCEQFVHFVRIIWVNYWGTILVLVYCW